MSNIDEEAKNNFTIEMRIFDNQNHEFWHSVINLKGLVLPISGFLPIRSISHIELGF